MLLQQKLLGNPVAKNYS